MRGEAAEDSEAREELEEHLQLSEVSFYYPVFLFLQVQINLSFY